MMRSLFSGVAGLKTHQTRMDVVGNNIANVNTVGFKSSSVNFADTFYQTVSSATGADATTGAAGTNAKQIGLGSSVASITTNITDQGGTSTTNRALDVAINGDSFLIVKSAGATYFTKSGAMNVDANGTLYCTTNGATVQGWVANKDGDIIKDRVQDLDVMSAENMYYEPTATSNITLKGNIDKMDSQLTVTKKDDAANDAAITDQGYPMTFSFFDNIGQLYSVKMYVYAQKTDDAAAGGADDTKLTNYSVALADVYDENGDSIFVEKGVGDDGLTSYKATGVKISFGGCEFTVADDAVDEKTGAFKLSSDGAPTLSFVTETGEFKSVTEKEGDKKIPETSKDSGNCIMFCITDAGNRDNTFSDYNTTTDKGGVKIDFSALTQYSQSGVSSTSYTKGDKDGYGTGNQAGEMSGISIDSKGYVLGTYSNGSKKVLAQIAVTTFANPSGLEAVGDSMFAASRNSGEFNGVGSDIGTTGGSFTVGALEMSNVDLAAEFTTMITTQRGFQANSRIITTSDSMLEELVNLKR
ncbi:MAG: flagellar hook-basal body complex protein [Lachnospiraceae bacterium]|nr:flagellar hook-basal body complex protein [Lachnospiraceae bacterium]